MFDIFFEKYPDYSTVQKPTEEVVAEFKGKLPDELLDFWNVYGFGTFMKGYLKVVDPSEFQVVFNEGYDNKDGEIVFAVTGLGDFLTWTGDAIRAVYFKSGYESIIESGDDMEWFFNMDLADEGFLRDNLDDKNYLDVKSKSGNLEFDECFGYLPLLGLGGPENADNLQKVKIKEHISLIVQTMGKIE